MSDEDLVDSLNRLHAAMRRLEESHMLLIRAMAETVKELRATYDLILEAQKPWWKR